MKKLIPVLIITMFIFSSCKKDEGMLSPSEQLNLDIQKIQEFLTLNDLTAQSTSSGLHYIITEEGTGTETPSLNDSVKVYYRGFYIESSVIFDKTEEGNPRTFLLSQMINGWKEGIPLFKKGAKGILLIPSGLAYGPYPPLGIPPNAVMGFEIELLDFYQ